MSLAYLSPTLCCAFSSLFISLSISTFLSLLGSLCTDSGLSGRAVFGFAVRLHYTRTAHLCHRICTHTVLRTTCTHCLPLLCYYSALSLLFSPPSLVVCRTVFITRSPLCFLLHRSHTCGYGFTTPYTCYLSSLSLARCLHRLRHLSLRVCYTHTDSLHTLHTGHLTTLTRLHHTLHTLSPAAHLPTLNTLFLSFCHLSGVC